MSKEKGIVEFIDLTRNKVALYIGKKSLTRYKAFLDGCLFDQENEVEQIKFMRSFQEWVQDRYQIKSSHSWSDIILFYSLNEQEALDTFLDHWDQFLNEKK